MDFLKAFLALGRSNHFQGKKLPQTTLHSFPSLKKMKIDLVNFSDEIPQSDEQL
jgi:hypothetical protein